MVRYKYIVSCVCIVIGLLLFSRPAQAFLPEQIFQHGVRSLKQIALTFDADMTPSMAAQLDNHKIQSWYNKSVIDILEKTNTKATLFLTGMWASLYPLETRRLSENPLFEIANHSYSHPSFGGQCYGLSQIPLADYPTEITKTQEVLTKLTGKSPTLFRFPGGCYDMYSMSVVERTGLQVIGWDVVSDDAFNFNTTAIIHNVLTQVKNGSVVVMHMHGGPNAPETAQALSVIIPTLKKEGYSFVQVSDLYATTQKEALTSCFQSVKSKPFPSIVMCF